MNEKNDYALVPRPPSTVEKVQPGAKRILSGMVADTFALVKKDQFAPARTKFQIGKQKFCEPDYLQVVAWAEQLKMTPLQVLGRLQKGFRRKGDETRIENGKFTKLNWDPGFLPLADFRISLPLEELVELSFAPIEQISQQNFDGLEYVRAGGVVARHTVGELIETSLGFDYIRAEDQVTEADIPRGYDESAKVLHISAVTLPKLRRLACESVFLKSLTMAQAPELEFLDCGWNDLSSVDLRSFPKLKNLVCGGNYWKSLDLSHVPELTELDCGGFNQLTELDSQLNLRCVPKLRKLDFSENRMIELVLPYLPELRELDCNNNGTGSLKRIDLRNVPSLEVLDCSTNKIATLDLRTVPRLRKLKCNCTFVQELDLSQVPLLEHLSCNSNNWGRHWIKTLDIRPLHHLKDLSRDERTQLIQNSDQHF